MSPELLLGALLAAAAVVFVADALRAAPVALRAPRFEVSADFLVGAMTATYPAVICRNR